MIMYTEKLNQSQGSTQNLMAATTEEESLAGSLSKQTLENQDQCFRDTALSGLTQIRESEEGPHPSQPSYDVSKIEPVKKKAQIKEPYYMLSRAKAQELANKYSSDRYPPSIENKRMRMTEKESRKYEEQEISVDFSYYVKRENFRAKTLQDRYPVMAEIEIDHKGLELVTQVKEIMLIFRKNHFSYVHLKANGR